MAPASLMFILLATTAPLLAAAWPHLDYPTANISTLWINTNASLPNSISSARSVSYPDGSGVRAMVLRSPQTMVGPAFAAGFVCASPCEMFLFAVFIVYTNSGARMSRPMLGMPPVVWSANRDRLVRENATIELTTDGDLILRDADGSLVWSSNSSRRSVVGMAITEIGNLVLFNKRKATVWQSFDTPTDTLLPGQSLLQGMRLIASTSATNWTEGPLYIIVLPSGLYAYAQSTPPQLYYSQWVNQSKVASDPTNVTFINGSLSFSLQPKEPSDLDTIISLPDAQSNQYIRLESDGHLRLYEWSNSGGWNVQYDLTKFSTYDCAFPTVCGEYGICTGGQCSCPFQSNSSSRYFEQVDELKANLGCAPLTPISCQEMQHHQLLTLADVSYFDVNHTVVSATNGDDCKQACLNNCSCRAVVFKYGNNDSDGDCLWVTKVFSLQSIQPEKVQYNSSAYLKVQLIPFAPATNANKKRVMLVATIGATCTLILLAIAVSLYVRRKRNNQESDEEFDFDQLPGKTMRFSLENLKECTEDFSKILGEGGFGTVFEGKLGEERVAVKRLEGARQGQKEFLAEVETIGSIEHLNLVRLIGFCVEKSQKLLVYEYMPRGSLDRWIYYRHNNAPLDWCTRCRIILDIAKGLRYLHEECRRKILHLDIKPQNILLDDDFNAKVADFGLSKLIDRDQSKVMTLMRGTPGYLAPEWLTSRITEKVDIYSFGVVIMEIISGRKNIDNSQSEENVQLINLLREKAQNNQLIDLIDKHSDDMISHQDKAIELMKLAIWCLQNDSTQRPTMSMVIEVLEGAMRVQATVLHSFLNPNSAMSVQHNPPTYSVPSQASILSGPR